MVERLYRILLRILPREFGDRFGSEMLETARAIDAEPCRRPLRALRAAIDAIRTAILLPREMLDADRTSNVGRRQAAGDRRALLSQDLRFAWRGLRREPGFALFVGATLALGIGANAAMFGIADRLLLRGPEHVEDASRVVRLYSSEQPPGMRASTTPWFGYVTYDLLRQGATTFEGVATYAVNDGVWEHGADARQVRVGFASADLFPLLGVAPIRGRFFTAEEDSPRGAERVAVISYGVWRDWFGGAEAIPGRTLTLNGERYHVIGVAPTGFTGPQLGRVDLWIPGNLLGARMTPDFTTSWNAQWVQIVGRLKPGVTFEQAGHDATAVHRRGYTGQDHWSRNATLTVASLRANDAGTEATELRVLRWLTGVAALVLVIACANVANLLLARGMRRGREMAVRAALGAGRMRLVRLLLVESLLLAAGGAAAGLLVADLVGDAARQTLFTSIEWTSSPVDARVLAISAALAIVTGVSIGLLPALRSSRTSLSETLKAGVRAGGGRRSRLRTALTVIQAAVSVLLLVGAGLFVKSLWQIGRLDLGIDPDRVLVAEVARPSLARVPAGTAREAERLRRHRFLVDALDRVRARPGVEAASVAHGMPFGNRFSLKVRVQGRETMPTLSTGGPSLSAVTSGYFDTVGTRVLRGRAFTAEDREGSEPVAIVSEQMARTVWPDADPLGGCLLIGGDGTPPCARVVGVAEDTHRSRLREDPVMHYYIPAGQEIRLGFSGPVLLVRSADPLRLVADLRRLMSDRDSSVTYVSAETIQARIDPQMRPWRLGASVFLISGLLALVVAAMGIYSVMSYLIADRRHEIGVRMALGATAGHIMWLVLRGSFLMAALGVAIGEAAAAVLGGQVAPLLFDTSPRDPFVFGAIGGLLLIVAMAATLAAARRARRVSALEALRAE